MAPKLSPETECELFALYEQYTVSLKPLLAFVETKVQEFPGPILNELRAVNDHVSRCFSNLTNKECHNEIGKAKGHLIRAMLDCYKLTLISYEDDVQDFYHQYKDVDLTVVNNGDFLPALKDKHKLATIKAKEAKIVESKAFPEKEKAYESYQEAILAYEAVIKHIDSNSAGLAKASQYARKQTWTQVWYCVLSAIIGCLLTLLIDYWRDIISWISGLFSR